MLGHRGRQHVYDDCSHEDGRQVINQLKDSEEQREHCGDVGAFT